MDTFIKEFNTRYSKEIEHLVTRAIERGANPSVSVQINHLKKLSEEGKRFRPFAVYSAYEACGGSEDIWDILIAVELLHFFALIHDDVMDRGMMRHGVQTAHVFAEEKYMTLGDSDCEHRGYSQGIILGNIVFSWSYEYFNRGLEKLSIDTKEKIREYFLSLIEEVNVGQMIDVDISCGTDTPLSDILTKNRLKSGNYTFLWPLVIGGGLASVQEETISWLKEFGSVLGEAFQAQDDILDTSKETGKALCQDIESGQQTLVTNYLLNHKEYKDTFLTYFKRSLTDQEKEEVITVIQTSGAKEYVETIAENAFSEARNLIESREEKEKKIFETLCTIVQKRKK